MESKKVFFRGPPWTTNPQLSHSWQIALWYGSTAWSRFHSTVLVVPLKANKKKTKKFFNGTGLDCLHPARQPLRCLTLATGILLVWISRCWLLCWRLPKPCNSEQLVTSLFVMYEGNLTLTFIIYSYSVSAGPQLLLYYCSLRYMSFCSWIWASIVSAKIDSL